MAKKEALGLKAQLELYFIAEALELKAVN